MKSCTLCCWSVALIAGAAIAIGAGRPDPMKDLKDAAKQMHKDVKDAAHAIDPTKKPAEPSPAEQAKMEADMKAMMAAGAVGAEHKSLEQFAGEWTCKMAFWMDANSPPMEGEGESDNEMVLGGRVLMQEFEGTSPMGTMHGVGQTGYDNVTKRWWSTWMDDMSTGIMMMYGDPKDNGMTMSGECTDCTTGKPMKMRTTLTIQSPDQHTFAMYTTKAGEKEFKSGEIVYTRKK